ncbi:hypothetical protein WDZ92_48560, partial [Nostoc sp. NIES-2111]
MTNQDKMSHSTTQKQSVYSIFGAGAAGLYTAWRLLEGKPSAGRTSKQPVKGDVLELYDWGRYNFSARHKGSRSAGARICTWFYKNDPQGSYLELGGMRYAHWDSSVKDTPISTTPGHRLVTTVIKQLGLDEHAVPFNVTNNQLFYLRSQNFYLNDITSHAPAPYSVIDFGAGSPPGKGFGVLEKLAVPSKAQTRTWWCDFYNTGTITERTPDYCVFQE